MRSTSMTSMPVPAIWLIANEYQPRCAQIQLRARSDAAETVKRRNACGPTRADSIVSSPAGGGDGEAFNHGEQDPLHQQWRLRGNGAGGVSIGRGRKIRGGQRGGRLRLDNRLGGAFVPGEGNHRGGRSRRAAISAAEEVIRIAPWRSASIAQANW